MYADMMDTIAFVKNADPEVGQAMERELQRQRRNLELIASENLVSSGRDGGDGQCAHQQIRRRLSRQALLRRLRVRGRGGEHRPRPRLPVFLGRSTPTYSPTPARRPIRQRTLPC